MHYCDKYLSDLVWSDKAVSGNTYEACCFASGQWVDVVVSQCIFQRCDFRQASFLSGCRFVGCIFEDCRWHESLCLELVFQDCQFLNNHWGPDNQLIQVDFQATVIQSSVFDHVQFNMLQLTSDTFVACQFPRSTFVSCDIEADLLSGRVWEQNSFIDCQLDPERVVEAYFKGCQWHDCQIQLEQLRYSIVEDANVLA